MAQACCSARALVFDSYKTLLYKDRRHLNPVRCYRRSFCKHRGLRCSFHMLTSLRQKVSAADLCLHHKLACCQSSQGRVLRARSCLLHAGAKRQ